MISYSNRALIIKYLRVIEESIINYFHSTMKTVLITCAAVASVVMATHPVNTEITNDIKQKTQMWKPFEPNENPLSYLTHEQLLGLLGTRILPP